MNGFTASNVPDQHGRCFIVTGANTGIGFEIARVLAARGARVLLACRDGSKAAAAIAEINRATSGADVSYLPLDLGDLSSVRQAVEIAGREPHLDVLINNAGVIMAPLSFTRDGYELQFGVNHLGTFALTGLLLPKLAESPGARVVVTSSLAHKGGKIDFANLDAAAGYGRIAAYGQSKLALMLFFFELDRRLRAAKSTIAAMGCHPGMAGTVGAARHFPKFLQLLTPVMMPIGNLFVNPPAGAAWPALQAATWEHARGGAYYGPQGIGEIRGPSGEAKRSASAEDVAVARKLWEVSIAMTGVDPGLP